MESFTLDAVAIEDGCTSFGTDTIFIDLHQVKQRTWNEKELLKGNVDILATTIDISGGGLKLFCGDTIWPKR